MPELFTLLADYPFMRNAMLASVLASLACGIIGALVVSNRLSFLAGGASHAAYGGIGIAFHWQLPVLPCTLAFSLAAALIMGWMTLNAEKSGPRSEAGQDAQVGVLWAAGMAVGIILIELTPGYAGELMGFLFGSILTVPENDLVFMALFDALLLTVLFAFRQGLWALTLDKEFARARGLPVDALFLLLVGLTALTTVMLIRIVGLILVLALLTIPALVARRFCRSLAGTMAASCLLSLLFCFAGLAVSWQTDISSGASIIAIGTTVYFAAHLTGKRKARAGSL